MFDDIDDFMNAVSIELLNYLGLTEEESRRIKTQARQFFNFYKNQLIPGTKYSLEFGETRQEFMHGLILNIKNILGID